MADLAPLLAHPQPIPAHAFMALGALVAGALQFVLPKGRGAHRALGWLYVVLMGAVAVSGLFITELRWIGPFSPIHLLSVLALYTLFRAVDAAYRGDIVTHSRAMGWLYGLGLVLTGAFTLLPGRAMHAVLFGG
ncbi:MAG: DUF2306 domain-containing protein [Alphaproteobacteria bacterium]|nr:DUF2306 domain-containing protein [Alphaproteobacteria bacterium]